MSLRRLSVVVAGLLSFISLLLPSATSALTTPYATGIYMFGRTTAGTYQADNCTDSSSGCTAPGFPASAFSGFGAFAASPVTFQEEPAVENFFYNTTDTLSSIMVAGRGADNNIYYSFGGGGTAAGVPPRAFTPFASLDNGQGIAFQGKPALARVCGANASTCHSLFIVARGNQAGHVANDYWIRIFSSQTSTWDTPWIPIGTSSPDDPIIVAPAFTTTYNQLYIYCRGGGDHAIYMRSIALQHPFSGVPGAADIDFVASPQWEGLPDSGNMLMTPNVTYVQTPRGQDQAWGFLRGGDNVVYYTTMNAPAHAACDVNQECTAPTRFTYDRAGNFTGVGGLLSFQQNPSGGFYFGVPGAAISTQSKPVAGWLRPTSSPAYAGGVTFVGRGNDGAYYYSVFNQGTNAWSGLKAIGNAGGFATDPTLNDANHFSLRLMGRIGTTLLYDYYNHVADVWGSTYFTVGAGFSSNPVLFNND